MKIHSLSLTFTARVLWSQGKGKGRENCSLATPSQTFSRLLPFHFKLEFLELYQTISDSLSAGRQVGRQVDGRLASRPKNRMDTLYRPLLEIC